MKKQSLIRGHLSSFTTSNVQKVIPLYDKKAPNSKDIDASDIFLTETEEFQFLTRVHITDLTVFLPDKSQSTGIGVIICPGGAYLGLAINNEGYDIAKKLNENGIAAFVLKYRLPNAEYVINKQIVPLQDAQRAIQLVRQNFKKFSVNPNKIGIAGSSAGGHLASTAGTHFHKEFIDNPLKISLRPDFLILNYSIISMADSLTHFLLRYNLIGEELSPKELNLIVTDRKTSEQKLANLPIDAEKIRDYSNELQVTSDTPPTFITHAVDDNSVKVQNSILFIAALQKNKIPVESFFYANGGHGYGIDNLTSDVDWIDSCVTWVLKMFFK